MEGGEEEGELEILRSCEDLVFYSSFSSPPSPSPSTSASLSSSPWQVALLQLQAAVNAMGPCSSPILLRFLRRPHLPDCVLDALAHSIALCCGSCSAPPSTLTFTFSPFLTVHGCSLDMAFAATVKSVCFQHVLGNRKEAMAGEVHPMTWWRGTSGCACNKGAPPWKQERCDSLGSTSKDMMVKEMDYIKGGLGWKVWGTALLLSWRIVSLQKSFQGKRVLELGSGCGLCGLLLVKLGASEVVLSDSVPDILANLCDNALLLPANIYQSIDSEGSTAFREHTKPSFDYAYDGAAAGSSLKAHPCMVRVRLLDWLEDASGSSTGILEEMKENVPSLLKLSADESFDWVIGSDLIYNHYSIQSLVGVIHRRLSKPQGQGLFAAPVRESQEFDFFLAELDLLGMSAHVEHCTEQEWKTCMAVLGTVKEGGTLHGIDHYEGGLVLISVTHKA